MNIAVQEKSAFNSIEGTFEAQKSNLKNLRKESVQKRKERLKTLRNWIHTNRSAIHEAMYNDFRKAAVEVDGVELFHVLNEIKYATDNLEQWARPTKVDAPLTMFGTRSWIQYEARGVCLIISPWNYPFSLCIGPVVSALCAGNSVIIKPSEMTPHVSSLIKKMVDEIFEPQVATVFEGGLEVSQRLLKLPFDHIFFTGSPDIGKVVMKAAAENLTSVTLELGGKSPSIITDSARINEAAERTAVAKFVNNGQTCIAPDYILVDEKVAAKFTSAIIEQTKKLFANAKGSFEESNSYCRIVNEKHFVRVNELIKDALNTGAKIEFGGKVNPETNFIHPMILSSVQMNSRVMQEEIFGPVLPIVTYKNLDDAITIIHSKPKALALYIYSTSKKVQEKILHETTAGAVCINDSGIHFLHHGLPFGGVNNSGIGKSHGHFGFLAFSNEKPVLKQKRGLTSVKAFYPPYTNLSKKLMDWFLKLF
ncbi:MAG TPA: aldehyde dehydrogenase family protein [Chryseolinea sp.]|nr:aldehyde dehydrogenase family protein [Chryseolinea sp.]HPH45397.1 aldehyde dehydrogenase family protein [Chryseolinea sp.]HPM28689.1 aldehyde dehydrogenase family protein [Chryseolinea sp.]